MAEDRTWLSYRPADLLMFSPRVYARLIELVNAQAWPASMAGLLAALVLDFHLRHFATINTTAPSWPLPSPGRPWSG